MDNYPDNSDDSEFSDEPKRASGSSSGALLLLLLVAGGGAFWFYHGRHQNNEAESPAPAVVAAATPVLSPTALAQREAVRRYPDLAVAGSKLNIAFVTRYKQYQTQHPEYFRDTSWPLHLAEAAAASLQQAPLPVATSTPTPPRDSSDWRLDATRKNALSAPKGKHKGL